MTDLPTRIARLRELQRRATHPHDWARQAAIELGHWKSEVTQESAAARRRASASLQAARTGR